MLASIWTAVLAVTAWAPLLLIIAGMVLAGVEAFVLPGFGVPGFLGLLAIAAGLVLAILGPLPGGADVVVAFATVLASLTLMGVALWGVLPRMKDRRHPLFGGVLPTDEGYLASLPRPELQGLTGVTVTDLRPAGTADFGGERLDVVSDAGWVPADTLVRIIRTEGYRHVVRAVPPVAVEEATPEAQDA